MRAPRFTIRTLVFATALVGVDCALLISGARTGPFGPSFWILTSFSMLNILAVVCYRNLTRGAPLKPFFLGFAAFGALSLLLWLNWCLRADYQTIKTFAQRTDQTQHIAYLGEISKRITNGTPFYIIISYVLLIFIHELAITALPHLAIALAGGWLAVVLNHRRASQQPVP